MSITAWNPKYLNFLKKFEIEFDLYYYYSNGLTRGYEFWIFFFNLAYDMNI